MEDKECPFCKGNPGIYNEHNVLWGMSRREILAMKEFACKKGWAEHWKECNVCGGSGQIVKQEDGKNIGLIACPYCQWPGRPDEQK